MAEEKKKPESPKEPSVEEIEQSQDFSTLEEKLEKEIGYDWVKSLKRIVYYTSRTGLQLREACILADVEYDEFINLANTNTTVKKILEKKELEYKKGLLFTVSSKARSGDDKLSLWLLENRFPDEFGGKKRGDGGNGPDLLKQAVIFIQQNGDNRPLVSVESGRPMLQPGKKDQKTPVERLQEYLA